MNVIEKKSKIKQTLKNLTPNFLWKTAAKVLNTFIPSRKYPPLYHFCKKHYNSDFWWADVTFCGDGLLTMHNCDFINDPMFKKSYELAQATKSWHLTNEGPANPVWRTYILCWVASQMQNIEGDFIEFGVNKGGYSRAVIHYIDFGNLPKIFYLLDTFKGFDERYVSVEEREHNTPAYSFYSECYEEVMHTFKGFKNVSIIRGAVPETLIEIKSTKIAYVSIDMNCVLPSIEAIKFVWHKMVPGGTIILDDYGWPRHFLQKKAFDEWALQNNTSILSLPTGQGMIVKLA